MRSDTLFKNTTYIWDASDPILYTLAKSSRAPYTPGLDTAANKDSGYSADSLTTDRVRQDLQVKARYDRILL